MADKDILDNEQLSWYEEDDNRLDYRLAFQSGEGGSGKENKANSEGISRREVREKLENRKKKWKERLKNARRNAYEKGFEKGKEEGHRKAEQEMQQRIQQLEEGLSQARREWQQRIKVLNAGLLDLVFELAEAVVGLPIEHSELRNTLEEKVSQLLHETEKNMKPKLSISSKDYEFAKDLVEQYAPEMSIKVQPDDSLHPGEFEFETEREAVVYRFEKMVQDFKETLSLPEWK